MRKISKQKIKPFGSIKKKKETYSAATKEATSEYKAIKDKSQITVLNTKKDLTYMILLTIITLILD